MIGARRGFTLLEVVMAVAIFLMILGISFLPFKMLSDAYKQGSGHVDAGEAAREALRAMVRDIRRGGMPLPSGTQMFSQPIWAQIYDSVSGSAQTVPAYQEITYTYTPHGYGEPVQYSDYVAPVTVASPGVAGDVNGGGESLVVSGQDTEYALWQDAHQTSGGSPLSASLTGYPRAVIPRGIWQFYLRPSSGYDSASLSPYPQTPAPTSTTSTPGANWDRQYVVLYAAVAPANDARPLTAPASPVPLALPIDAPTGLLEYSTEFSLRNVPVLP